MASARCASIAEDDVTTRRELEAVLRLNPNDATLTMQVAIMQNQQFWMEESAATNQRAAELGLRAPTIFYNYAVLLNTLGRVDEARANLDRALALAPDSIFFRVYRTMCEISWTGDVDRAKAILAQAPAGKDPDGRVTAQRCSLAILERNFPEALQILHAYQGETLPSVLNGGFGFQRSKRYSEGFIHLWAGEREAALSCFEAERPGMGKTLRTTRRIEWLAES